jgi:hypothetical protein
MTPRNSFGSDSLKLLPAFSCVPRDIRHTLPPNAANHQLVNFLELQTSCTPQRAPRRRRTTRPTPTPVDSYNRSVSPCRGGSRGSRWDPPSGPPRFLGSPPLNRSSVSPACVCGTPPPLPGCAAASSAPQQSTHVSPSLAASWHRPHPAPMSCRSPPAVRAPAGGEKDREERDLKSQKKNPRGSGRKGFVPRDPPSLAEPTRIPGRKHPGLAP